MIGTHAWASATYPDIYIHVREHTLGEIAGNQFNQPYRVTDRLKHLNESQVPEHC